MQCKRPFPPCMSVLQCLRPLLYTIYYTLDGSAYCWVFLRIKNRITPIYVTDAAPLTTLPPYWGEFTTCSRFTAELSLIHMKGLEEIHPPAAETAPFRCREIPAISLPSVNLPCRTLTHCRFVFRPMQFMFFSLEGAPCITCMNILSYMIAMLSGDTVYLHIPGDPA